MHLANAKSSINTSGFRAHISQNKTNKGYFFLLLHQMCILLSHGCLMLLVAVPPLSLFRQLEASSRRESWYLCWGFWTDHKQGELLPVPRQPATDTSTFTLNTLGKTRTGWDGGSHTYQVRLLCLNIINRGRRAASQSAPKASTFYRCSYPPPHPHNWSGKMFHLHLALESVPAIANCRSGSLLVPDWLGV